MKFQTYSEIKSNVGHNHDIHAPNANLNGYPKVCSLLCRNQGIWCTSHNIKMLYHNTQIFKPALNYYLPAQSFSCTVLF